MEMRSVNAALSAYTLVFVQACEDEHLRKNTVTISSVISDLAPSAAEGQ